MRASPLLALLCVLLAARVRSEAPEENELAPQLWETLEAEELREERSSCEGTCQDISKDPCTGRLDPGLCLGGRHLYCCVPANYCSYRGRAGVCQANNLPCDGEYLHGNHCPSSNLRCCLGATAPPPPPPPPPRPPPPPSTTTGGSSGGNVWLSTATGGGRSYPVERIDRSTTLPGSPRPHEAPVNKFLLHTLEGRWPLDGDYELAKRVYDSRRTWPHFIVGRDLSGAVRIGQFLRLDQKAYVLRNGDELGVIQVEVGAKADQPFTSYDPEVTAAVKALFKTLQRHTAIPNAAPVAFVGRSGIGFKAPQRLSRTAFRGTAGIVGHQHVFDQSHYDPGMIDPARLTSA